MKQFWGGAIAVLLLFLTACGSTTPQQSMPIPRMIDVELMLAESSLPGETVPIATRVTLDGEAVTDADEVRFEIWRYGQRDQSESVYGNHVGDGVYEQSYTFPEDGAYYVISHVTVEEMHNMPRKKIIVGDAPAEEIEQDEPHYQTMEEHERNR